MKAFKNCNVYVEGKGIIVSSLYFNDKIVSLEKDYDKEAEIIEIEKDAFVFPGFIDQHIHGSASADAMDATGNALETIAKSLATEGTTAFLATTMTQSQEKILNAMHAVKEYMQEEHEEGAQLLGVHLEGPFINEKKAGAQPAEFIAALNIEQFKKYNEASGNNIKIVTLAPECENSDSFISYLSESGIAPSIGHTNATYNQAVTACNNGAKQITHTFNAQSAFTHREIGVVGAAFMEDRLACEIICDTIHVSVPAIKALIKNKPHNKIIAITDAMRAKNLGDTVSELGGQTVYVKNGEARLNDGTLAGSVLRMCDAINNLVNKCYISICDAVDFASANPAKNLGLYDTMGSIAVNKAANLVVMSKDLKRVIMTIRSGKIVYENNR